MKNWDVSNINRMSGLFEGCISLKNISSLKNWDMSNVISLDYLFRECHSLENISHIKDWNVENVKSAKGMFDDCISLKNISPLSGWDVSNINQLNKMFYNCTSLIDVLPLSDWKIDDDSSIDYIFDNCDELNDFPQWYKAYIIKNNIDSKNSQKVIATLDEEFFKNNELNLFDEKTQLLFIQSIDNQSILAFLVGKSNFKRVQELALEKITNEDILTDIAINDYNYDIGVDSGANDYKFYFYNRENAFIKIKNKTRLLKVARESQHILENIRHIDNFIDGEDDLVDLVLNAKSIDVRLFSLARIKDKESLLRIANECDNEGIKTLAGRNLK